MNNYKRIYTSKSEKYARAKIEQIADISENFCEIFDEIKNQAKLKEKEGKQARKTVYIFHPDDSQKAQLIKLGDFCKAMKNTFTLYTAEVVKQTSIIKPSGREVNVPEEIRFFSNVEFDEIDGRDASDKEKFNILLKFDRENAEAFEAAQIASKAIAEASTEASK
jgi:hypothetical protein